MKPNERLHSIRKKLGYTQKEFASQLEMKQGSYSAVESGTANISKKLKLLLDTVFNVNTEWLDNGAGEPFYPHTPHVADRIKDILVHFNINIENLISDIGLDDLDGSEFKKNIREDGEIKGRYINAITAKYPEVSRRYLLSGIGNVLLPATYMSSSRFEILTY